MHIRSYFFLSVFMILFTTAYAQPGALDVTFGTAGIVTTPIGTGDDKGYSVIQQTDGKLVVAGLSSNGTNNDFAVVRYNSDGSLDLGFGGTGYVTTPIGTGNDVGQCIIQQPDGKLLVAGYNESATGVNFALVRYNTDGTLDGTFGTGGIVSTPILGYPTSRAHSLAIQSDGKIVLAGVSQSASNSNFSIARYTTAGALDLTFATSGYITTNVGSTVDEGRSVIIQPDGKILVGGWTSNGSDFDFAIVRYSTSGGLDLTFDVDGIVTTDFAGLDDQGYSLELESSGKIILAGLSNNGADLDFGIARYNSDGSLDLTFDTDGKVTTDFVSGNDLGYSVKIQSDSKILVAGQIQNTSGNDFGLARYNPDGSLDLTFDTDGKVETDIGSNGNDVGWSIAIQYDAKTVVAGSGATSNFNMAVARYNACDIIDVTVTQTDSVLSVAGSGAYQWVICDSVFTPIPGATNQELTLLANGIYAVIIDLEVCRDTSACININSLGLPVDTENKNLILFPNPASDALTVITDHYLQQAEVRVITLTGKEVLFRGSLEGNKITLDVSGLPEGAYILELHEQGQVLRSKVIIR